MTSPFRITSYNVCYTKLLRAELQFETAYPAKQLVPAAQEAQSFSLDDASHYFHLLECIAELPLSEPERVQIVLNAIAACRFCKPMLPQSWFFRNNFV